MLDIFAPLRPYLAIGKLVLWGIVLCALVYFYWQYQRGQDALDKLNAQKAAVKVEVAMVKDITKSDTKAAEVQTKIKTVYKTIYVEVNNHANSGLDDTPLSSGWVRIFNEGARGMSEDTSPVAIDDATPSNVTGAGALGTITQSQQQYYEVRNQLIQCQNYVKALEPMYR